LRTVDAYVALDIMAKDGWISMDDNAMRGSTLQFITTTETLYTYQVAEPTIDKLSKALLRGYEGLWTSTVHIQESRIAKFLDWSIAEVRKQLTRLHSMGLVDYRNSNTKSQITLLRERVPEQNFTFDLKAYNFRKDRAFARMNSMLNYLKDDVRCREVFIRQYFDEHDTLSCGHCDRCLNDQPKQANWLELIYKVLDDHDGITVKDFLGQYKTEHQPAIKGELRQLADENKIKIVEDKIYRSGK
jgi:ATP-dependent DNA helicase RecQ